MNDIETFLEAEKKGDEEWFRENHTALRNMNVDEAHILYTEHASASHQRLLAKVREDVLEILVNEINTAHTSESGKTSRLTSAYNRISALLPLQENE